MEALQVVCRRQQAGMGNLEGHGALEFGVLGPPDGAEGAQADPLQKLKLAQRAHGARRGRLPGFADAERATAARAEHLVGLVVYDLDRVVAMRAADPRRSR